MKKAALLLLAMLCPLLAFGQTARQYYKEVHDAGGLNPLLMFVCFPEEDTGLFEAIALTRTFPKTIEQKHLSKSTEKDDALFVKSDMLYLQAFYKGIPRDPILFDKVEKNSDVAWVANFTGVVEGHTNTEGRITYRINWQTLRYEKEVKFGTAVSMGYGRCELIR